MSLEKKKRWLCFFVFFPQYQKWPKKKCKRHMFIASTRANQWSHGSFQLGNLTRMSPVNVADIFMKELVKYWKTSQLLLKKINLPMFKIFPWKPPRRFWKVPKKPPKNILPLKKSQQLRKAPKFRGKVPKLATVPRIRNIS